MCWYSLDIEDRKPKVAQGDVKVKKVLIDMGDGVYCSPYFDYEYEGGKRYGTKLGLYPYELSLKIEEGFHSFSVGCEFSTMQWYGRDEIYVLGCHYNFPIPFYINSSKRVGTISVVDCIIPDGSTYFINKQGEIVSDSLIIIGESDDGA